MLTRICLALATAALSMGCGAKVVVENEGGGSGVGGTAAAPPPGTVCTSQADCAPFVCIIETGECQEPCTGCENTCGPGMVCDDCATSSAPGTDDCIAACAPPFFDSCDEDDPCPGGGVCNFEERLCMAPCTPPDPCSPTHSCHPCGVLGPCCGCSECIAACVPI